MPGWQIRILKGAFLISLFPNVLTLLEYICDCIDEFYSHQHVQNMTMTHENRSLVNNIVDAAGNSTMTLKLSIGVLVIGIYVYIVRLVARMPTLTIAQQLNLIPPVPLRAYFTAAFSYSAIKPDRQIGILKLAFAISLHMNRGTLIGLINADVSSFFTQEIRQMAMTHESRLLRDAAS